MLTPSVERPHMGPIAIPAPARTSVAAPHTTPKIVEAVPPNGPAPSRKVVTAAAPPATAPPITAPITAPVAPKATRPIRVSPTAATGTITAPAGKPSAAGSATMPSPAPATAPGTAPTAENAVVSTICFRSPRSFSTISGSLMILYPACGREASDVAALNPCFTPFLTDSFSMSVLVRVFFRTVLSLMRYTPS